MFTVTEEAKIEIQKRLIELEPKNLIRLQMLYSCYMKLKLIIIIITTLMTAAAVSICGVIGWVGLVIPHAGRLIVGSDHKYLLPISLILGGAFLLTIDNVARTLLPGEIPLGVLTGLIGVPILIVLMRRSKTGW